MAQYVETRLVDDLDGSEASNTVAFGLDGRDYEIDLSDSNASNLREALASFVAAARKGGGRSATAPRPAAPRRASADREQTTAVRQWARENGFEVSERGRIPNTVLQAYDERASASAPEPAPEPVAAAPKKPRKRATKVADKAEKRAS